MCDFSLVSDLGFWIWEENKFQKKTPKTSKTPCKMKYFPFLARIGEGGFGLQIPSGYAPGVAFIT